MPPWMIGVVAWRGETIAVIDLEAYLSGSSEHLLQEGILLIANHAGLPLGLVVLSIGQLSPLETEALVLDLPVLLTAIVQQIGTAATDG